MYLRRVRLAIWFGAVIATATGEYVVVNKVKGIGRVWSKEWVQVRDLCPWRQEGMLA